MSKRILALALFAVMVLSLVPMAQAAPTNQNVVYEINVRNQSDPARVGDYSYVGAVSGSGPLTGNQQKTSSFASGDSYDVLTINAAFSDLYKRGQNYSTDNVARYDVFVKIPLNFAATVASPTDTLINLPGSNGTITVPAGGLTPDPLVTAGGVSTTPNVTAAKAYLDFSALTVNGNRLSTDFLRASYLASEVDGINTWAYYYLKIGEFDATDVASASSDYVLVYSPYQGGSYTKRIRVAYTNSGESDKPIKPLYLKPVRKGTEGVYNIYVVNGVVFIDYAQDIGGADYLYRTYDGTTYKSGAVYAAIPVGFKFYEDAAATVRIPSYGKYAYVVPSTNTDDTPVSENNSRFFVSIGDGKLLADTTTGHLQGLAGPYQIRYIDYADTIDNRADAPFIIPPASAKDTRGRITNGDDKVLGVWLPNTYGTKDTYAELDTVAERTGVRGSTFTESTNRTMKVAIEDENYRYRTGDIKVVFRPLARNLITTAVIVERYLTLAVGEKVTLTIESASATTFDNIKLSEVSSTKSHVYIDGMDVTGISVGTSQIQVSASSKVIDQITVNVVATKETAAAEVVVTNQWRVIARKLNIRTGPGTSYGKAGTLAMNQVVAGTDTGTGWVEIGAGQYVSKQYVVPVTGSATGIGTYTISASSLNVRSGPGSSYAKTGSVTRGTIVEVIAIQNGWAQLASGGWVSTTYLK